MEETGTIEREEIKSERPLFQKRPLIPTIQDYGIKAVQPQPATIEEQANQIEEKKEEPKWKSVEVQTIYRDSEAQTDPYTCDHRELEGEIPEVLSLIHLKWGKGLPATIEELEEIEQTREKKWFELSLPPISDEASFGLRRKLMDEQEIRDWGKKENEIKKYDNNLAGKNCNLTP